MARPGNVEMGQQPLAVPIMQRKGRRIADDQRPAVGMLGIDVLQVERQPRRGRAAHGQRLAGEAGRDRPVDMAGDHPDDLLGRADHRLQPLHPGLAAQRAHPVDAGVDRRVVEDDDRRNVLALAAAAS